VLLKCQRLKYPRKKCIKNILGINTALVKFDENDFKTLDTVFKYNNFINENQENIREVSLIN
jgi:hypothetical protein